MRFIKTRGKGSRQKKKKNLHGKGLPIELRFIASGLLPDVKTREGTGEKKNSKSTDEKNKRQFYHKVNTRELKKSQGIKNFFFSFWGKLNTKKKKNAFPLTFGICFFVTIYNGQRKTHSVFKYFSSLTKNKKTRENDGLCNRQ